MSKVYPIAVIGGGSAGVMSALRGVLNNDEVLFFPGSPKHKKKSRAFWVTKVENMPGHLEYKKGIENPNKESLDWLLSGEFKDNLHYFKNKGIHKIERVTKGDENYFILTDNADEEYRAQYVIMCTGLMDVQPEINGSIRPIFPFANVQLADYCLRCDGHHIYKKDTSIIGHSNGAGWVACMLYERYKTPSMTILTNGHEPEFSDEVKELIEMYGINVHKGAITEVQGKPKENILSGYQLEDGSVVETDITFISLGMIIYNELAVSLGANIDERGFVVTNDKGETNIDGLYVAGDLRAGLKKQIYTAWDSAVDSADDINAKLRRFHRAEALKKYRSEK
jgi:thioredoxin reductase (NADPH)